MAIFEITLLFLGSVIGAGFATGAEIIAFFGHLQLPVWCIAVLVGLTMFAVVALEIHLNYPHTKLIQPLPLDTRRQPCLSKISDTIFIVIYMILFTAMTAGVTQITNVGVCIFSLVVSSCIVLFGFNKLSRLNFYIVLIIIVLIVTTALPHLWNLPTITINYHWDNFPAGIFWAFLYAGLNCFMFPELIKAAAQRHQRRTLLWAGAITAFLVTILVGLILTTIHQAHTTTAPIPLLAAAPNAITIIVILLAVLTSQYAALFAILQRCQKLFSTTKNRPLYSAIGVCCCAFIGSFCGFNHIVNFAYPLIGAFTCVYLLLSWLIFWRAQKRVRR